MKQNDVKEEMNSLAYEEEPGEQTDKAAQEKNDDEMRQAKEQARDERKMYITGMVTGALAALAIVGIAYLARAIGDRNGETIADVVKENVQTQEQTYSTILNETSENKIHLIENTIDTYFYEDVDKEQLMDGMYRGILRGLNDKYTEYYNEAEYRKLQDTTTGAYCGIGAYIGMDKETGYTYISGVIPNTPAQRAGLEAGDLIAAVDGEDAAGFTTTDASTRIRGPENTTVLLTIYRKNGDIYDAIDIEVTRAIVESQTVDYEMLENNIAHIWIYQFDTVTEKQFADALAQAREEGMKGLILDLRDNPGGNLTTVVAIGRQMLPEGLIVYKENKQGNRTEYKNTKDSTLEVPLVVLINGNSASASEILSGAVRDHKVGTLIGTTTYGKGVVQSVIDFPDGTAMKLTSAKYFTPNGENIDGVGIEPDIEVELDYEAYKADGTDNQLNAAIEYLAK